MRQCGAWTWIQTFCTYSSELPKPTPSETSSLKASSPYLGTHSPTLSSSPSKEANSKWLDAHYDPMANIHTFSACLGESLEPGILGSGEKEESDNGSVVKPLGF